MFPITFLLFMYSLQTEVAPAIVRSREYRLNQRSCVSFSPPKNHISEEYYSSGSTAPIYSLTSREQTQHFIHELAFYFTLLLFLMSML